MNQPTSQFLAIDTTTLPWEERFSEQIGKAIFRKEFFSDPDTGMMVRLVEYPAGVINPAHTHPCGHGMYVLEGNAGDAQRDIRPRQLRLVSRRGRDGARRTADGDVIVVFITNKPFRIDYVAKK